MKIILDNIYYQCILLIIKAARNVNPIRRLKPFVKYKRRPLPIGAEGGYVPHTKGDKLNTYEITKKAYRCLRCAHEWFPTKGKYKTADEKPRRCPACKSEYWDKEKI